MAGVLVVGGGLHGRGHLQRVAMLQADDRLERVDQDGLRLVGDGEIGLLQAEQRVEVDLGHLQLGNLELGKLELGKVGLAMM